MPPRQRSKKISASRKAEKDSALKSERTREESESESENEIEEESEEELEKDVEEEDLEGLVLGDGAGFMAQLGSQMEVDSEDDNVEEQESNDEGGLEHLDDADLFFVDAGPSDSTAIISADTTNGDGPAWEDSDDDRLAISLAGNPRLRKLRVNENEDVVNGREYTRRLRKQFERLNPVPEWASSSRPAKRRRRSSAGSDDSMSSIDMDVDDSDLSTLPLARILQDAGSLRNKPINSGKRTKLRPEVIDIQQTRAIPLVQPSSISSLSFHPEYPVILSSGPAATLYLHHVAPTALPNPHPLLTSVHIKNTPLHTSAFLGPKGDKIIFSGRRRYFHTWDMPSGTIQKVTRIYGQKEEQRTMEKFKLSPCGRYMALVGSSRKGGGIINILDANTTQWVASMRIEGANGVADFAWWRDGDGITVIGKGGEVGEWNVESRSYVARWIDDGHAPTVLTLGGSNGPAELGGDRWVVIGSQSGIVNIYDRRDFANEQGKISIPERPRPKRSFDQFTKPTSNLEISPDGQLLAFSSKWKKDALRLVHLPSCTVYRNWPTDKTPLGKITAVAFGAQSDMIAVANESGKIRLWDIRA